MYKFENNKLLKNNAILLTFFVFIFCSCSIKKSVSKKEYLLQIECATSSWRKIRIKNIETVEKLIILKFGNVTPTKVVLKDKSIWQWNLDGTAYISIAFYADTNEIFFSKTDFLNGQPITTNLTSTDFNKFDFDDWDYLIINELRKIYPKEWKFFF